MSPTGAENFQVNGENSAAWFPMALTAALFLNNAQARTLARALPWDVGGAMNMNSSAEAVHAADLGSRGALGDAGIQGQTMPDYSVEAPVTDLDLGTLWPGTTITVDTRNSSYHLNIVDGNAGRVLIRGGRYCRQQTEARVEGSTLGGSLLRAGWVGVGLFLEIVVGGKRIVTSRIRSITVDASHS